MDAFALFRHFYSFLQNPTIVSIHCVAHRLALAVASAAKHHSSINLCLSTLDSVHSYYSKSPVRNATFISVQACCVDIIFSLSL